MGEARWAEGGWKPVYWVKYPMIRPGNPGAPVYRWRQVGKLVYNNTGDQRGDEEPAEESGPESEDKEVEEEKDDPSPRSDE